MIRWTHPNIFLLLIVEKYQSTFGTWGAKKKNFPLKVGWTPRDGHVASIPGLWLLGNLSRKLKNISYQIYRPIQVHGDKKMSPFLWLQHTKFTNFFWAVSLHKISQHLHEYYVMERFFGFFDNIPVFFFFFLANEKHAWVSHKLYDSFSHLRFKRHFHFCFGLTEKHLSNMSVSNHFKSWNLKLNV